MLGWSGMCMVHLHTVLVNELATAAERHTLLTWVVCTIAAWAAYCT